MSVVRYHEILDTLKSILEASDTLVGVPVAIEQDPSFDVGGAGKALIITLGSRRPTGGQSLSAGKRTRYEIRLSVWALGFAVSFEEAAKARDELVAALELVLMSNRTVGDVVATGWLEGGEFISVRDTQGCYAMAETIFVCEASAVNA